MSLLVCTKAPQPPALLTVPFSLLRIVLFRLALDQKAYIEKYGGSGQAPIA